MTSLIAKSDNTDSKEITSITTSARRADVVNVLRLRHHGTATSSRQRTTTTAAEGASISGHRLYRDIRRHTQTMSLAAEQRKVNKPLVERRRRERINRCLDELKDLLISQRTANQASSRLEKADILELAVDELRSLRHTKSHSATAVGSSTSTSYKAGYSDCLRQAIDYVTKFDHVSPDTKYRLAKELKSLNSRFSDDVTLSVTSCQLVSPMPCCSYPSAITASPVTSSAIHPTNYVDELTARTGENAGRRPLANLQQVATISTALWFPPSRYFRDTSIGAPSSSASKDLQVNISNHVWMADPCASIGHYNRPRHSPAIEAESFDRLSWSRDNDVSTSAADDRDTIVDIDVDYCEVWRPW